ncbi:SprT family zinc-dependent metalloprotease [Aurantivibrio plasticivorans]
MIRRPPKTSVPIALDLFDSLSPERGELGFSLTIKRSVRRRTLEIVVRNGEVFLMTPQFVSRDEGIAFVKSKRDWVLNTLSKQQAVLDETPQKYYKAGELYSFLGEEYPLILFDAPRKTVMLNEEGLCVGVRMNRGEIEPDKVRKAIHEWYKAQALTLLTAKAHRLAASIGKTVSGVKVRATKTKWGHCTADGVLQFNWYVLAAPEWVIDYLVAHEVSHLKHRHHRASFWRLVEKLCPQTNEAKQWLKSHSHRITF